MVVVNRITVTLNPFVIVLFMFIFPEYNNILKG